MLCRIFNFKAIFRASEVPLFGVDQLTGLGRFFRPGQTSQASEGKKGPPDVSGPFCGYVMMVSPIAWLIFSMAIGN